MTHQLPVTDGHLDCLSILSMLTKDFGREVHSIRIWGSRVYSCDEAGHDITYVNVHEQDTVRDQERYAIRSEALARGWQIR